MTQRNDENRAVITGMGVKTPAGCDLDTFWARVQSGKPTARIITNFDASALSVRFACEVDDDALDIEKYANSKEVRRWDRFTQLGVAAAMDAFENSGLGEGDFDPFRSAVVTGTGVGGILTLEEQWSVYQEKGPGRVSPFFVPSMMANAIAGHASIMCGFAGVNFNVTTACAAGTHAIGEAARLIWDGTADVVLSGGAEAGVTPLVMSAFAKMGALSSRNEDPTRASRPFDANRDGFVLGEGAGFVIMESLAHAKKRDANILAEIVGYGRSGDAHHITAPLPDGSGAARSMQMALSIAGYSPEQVAHINAHATSTPLNDSGETQAMHHVFGDAVPPVSGTKGVTGHLIAAAGAVEAIISALTIRDKVMPPTANFEKAGDDIDLDIVHGEPRAYDGGAVLSNSFGFGGHNASVLIAPL
ncbi:MAG TPA: beta-ketoacyl-ACP synthase II [Acidimicrobiia bacterium]|mgnify:CR=1 FL=1|nr:beta-ketoacyl-ACP synthase II [Acidimicrobiia bacterium]